MLQHPLYWRLPITLLDLCLVLPLSLLALRLCCLGMDLKRMLPRPWWHHPLCLSHKGLG